MSIFVFYHEHDYFYGQIGFLIESSKQQSDGVYCINTFKRNASKAATLFSEEILGRDDYLLHRALLTFGDYLVWQGSNKCFCRSSQSNARDRNENWRAVFNDKEQRQTMLYQLINSLDENHEITGMQNLIDKSTVNDWRRFIIEEPYMLKKCKKMCIRFDYGDDGEIYLLCGQRMSGYHYGLYSYFIYLKLLKPNIDKTSSLAPFLVNEAKYNFVAGDNYVPSVQFNSWRGGELNFYYSESFNFEFWLDGKKVELEENEQTEALREFSHEITRLKEV